MRLLKHIVKQYELGTLLIVFIKERLMQQKLKPSIFVWQTPVLYKYGGLYLNIWGKRYRIFKWGKH